MSIILTLLPAFFLFQGGAKRPGPGVGIIAPYPGAAIVTPPKDPDPSSTSVTTTRRESTGDAPPVQERILVKRRDIARIEGVRTNSLEGVGLITGLRGTGDGTPAARIALRDFLNRWDLPVKSADLASGNYALVRVAAKLPIFPKNGQQVDATVASLGDATSLRGGRLLTVLLKDPFSKTVLATASGGLIVGGFSAEGKNANVTQNHTTVGTVPGGAILEPMVKDLQPKLLNEEQELVLITNLHSFTTHVRMAKVINEKLLQKEAIGRARANKNGVSITLDPAYRSNELVTNLLSRIWELEMEIESQSKIVIDETTQTVIIGQDVVIEPCIVNAGSLTIQVTEDEYASQPLAGFSQGQTTKVNRTRIDVQSDETGPKAFSGGGSLKDLLLALKSLGTSGPEMINVIRAMKRAGKIHADLETL